MTGKVQQLEARVAHLEQELRQLKEQLRDRAGLPWYRQIVGAFAGDPAYAEINRLGRQLRRVGRKRAR